MIARVIRNFFRITYIYYAETNTPSLYKLLIVIFLSVLFGCNKKEAVPNSEIAEQMAKLRSFVFVNSDSVQHYKTELQKYVDPANPLHMGMLRFGDALYNITAGVHSKALIELDEAIPLFKKAKNDSFLSYCYLGKGNCYKLNGNEDSAIFYYLTALHRFEKVNDKFYTTVSLVNIAETYQQKNDLANAWKYLRLGKANEPYGSKIYVSIIHLEANQYGMAGKTDSAMLTDRIGIALAKKYNYPYKLSSFYDNTAQCYMEWKIYDSAEYYYRKCVEADSLNGRLQLMADSYTQLVQLYGIQKEEGKMLTAAANAFKLCDSTQYLRGKYAVYEGLNNYYISARNIIKSSEAKDSLLQIYKRLVTEETEAKAAQYNIEFETSRKEKLISEQQNQLQKERSVTLLLGLLAASLLLAIYALYRNYRTGKSIAVNEAIQQQKDMNVKAVFDTEQAERVRIARDLHDSIGQKLSVLKMYLSGKEEHFAKSPALLDETIQEVRNISHNLLPEELNFGLLKAIRTDLDTLKNTGKIDSDIEVSGEEHLRMIPLPVSLNILMVFRELIANIAKHSSADKVTLQISSTKRSLSLVLRDNGKGIPEKAISESKGIGWKNIFTRINMLKGEIEIKPGTSSGNIVTIKISFT